MQQPVSKSSVSQVGSSHVEGTSQAPALKNDSLLLINIQNLIESREKHSNNVLIYYQNK